MLTIFSNPRPFVGPFDIIQRNAIKSWLLLRPPVEIILFEDEEKTTSKVAQELGVYCISQVRCDEFGTPLLSDVFNKTRKMAANDILAQVNTDIILLNDFVEAVKQVKEMMKEKTFFMTGRRWNLDTIEPIQFADSDWERQLRERVAKAGKQHRLSGMDYWVFPRDAKFNPPPFIVGRPGMDSWLIYKMRSLKIPVIDATEVVTIIHQNHNYPRKKDSFFEIEKLRNRELAGGFTSMCTLRDADWRLTVDGLKRPKFPRRIFSLLTLFYPWRMLMALQRRWRKL